MLDDGEWRMADLERLLGIDRSELATCLRVLERRGRVVSRLDDPPSEERVYQLVNS